MQRDAGTFSDPRLLRRSDVIHRTVTLAQPPPNRLTGMSDDSSTFTSVLSRRGLLSGALSAGVGAGAVAAVGLPGTASAAEPAADTSPSWREHGDPVATPPVSGLHLQFGADASSEVVVSWHSLQPVRGARVLLGTPVGYQRSVPARRESYTDAKSGTVVHAYHARLQGLRADREYLYVALHDGAEPDFGSFRTAPRGRSTLTFTSFGDQGTPTVGRTYQPPTGFSLQVNDNLGSPAAGDIDRRGRAAAAAVPPVQRRPVLRQPGHRPGPHLVGLLEQQHPQRPVPPLDAVGRATTRTSSATARSGTARTRRTSTLPRAAGSDRRDARPLVRVHGRLGAGDQPRQRRRRATRTAATRYVRGYCGGAQKRWLERELAARSQRTATSTGSSSACTRWRSARPTSSTAPTSASARSGCRCSTGTASTSWSAATSTTTSAHTRSAGSRPNDTLTPIPRGTDTKVVDTTAGTVHMVHRRRRHLGAVQRPVLQPAGVPRHHGRGEHRPGHRQAAARYVQETGTVVGRPRRGPRLRLRRLRRSTRAPGAAA